MIGGGLGPFKPGEWTDDTSMAIAIAEIAATGADLRDEAAQDDIVDALALVGRRRAKDVGIQTRSVLIAAAGGGISAATGPRRGGQHCTSAPAAPPATAR